MNVYSTQLSSFSFVLANVVVNSVILLLVFCIYIYLNFNDCFSPRRLETKKCGSLFVTGLLELLQFCLRFYATGILLFPATKSSEESQDEETEMFKKLYVEWKGEEHFKDPQYKAIPRFYFKVQ